MSISRRTILQGATAAATIGTFQVARAQSAEFTYKYANNLPVSHPMNLRATEAMEKIKSETNGRVVIQIFPNNQLGSDTDMLNQVRSGGVEFFTLSPLILTVVLAAIGWGMVAQGKKTMASEGLAPRATRETLQEDARWARGKVHEVKEEMIHGR